MADLTYICVYDRRVFQQGAQHALSTPDLLSKWRSTPDLISSITNNRRWLRPQQTPELTTTVTSMSATVEDLLSSTDSDRTDNRHRTPDVHVTSVIVSHAVRKAAN
jgi:hypothetical protein